MTKKDYVQIADIILSEVCRASVENPEPEVFQRVEAQIRRLADQLASYFERENTFFRREEFLRACGVQA